MDDPTYYWRLFNLQVVKTNKQKEINRELRKELIKARREIIQLRRVKDEL